MSGYAAAGWLMRAMLVILLAADMTPAAWAVLPFAMECFLKLSVLAGFLTSETATERNVSENPAGHCTDRNPVISQALEQRIMG